MKTNNFQESLEKTFR